MSLPVHLADSLAGLRRMEQAGIIRGRVAVIDPAKVGLPVSVFVAVETADHSGDWLKRFADHFDRAVWINPEPAREWDYVQTPRVIRKLFPMFHLSVDGITDAVKSLVGARV